MSDNRAVDLDSDHTLDTALRSEVTAEVPRPR